MISVKQTGQKSSRKSLKSSASLLGLSAGALGWSSLAQSSSEETAAQMMLLPEHYELLDNGVVMLKLQTGENMSLIADQYLILEDGLLLITDELAQASIYSLPVMGSVRAQLMNGVQAVRSPDGSVVLASDASPLWSGDGPAPRLFEQVDVQRYELAQNEQELSPETNNAAMQNVAAGGLSLAGLGLVSGIFGKKPEAEASEEAPSEPALHPDAGQTFKVDDLHPGAELDTTGSTSPTYLYALDGKLYFNGPSSNMYVYDPDTGSTEQVFGTGSTGASYMEALDGKLYFKGTDGSDSELRVYDPVAASITAVASANLNSGGSTNPKHMHALDGKLYFNGSDGTESELYVYDPVADTTTAVTSADLNSGGSTSQSYMHALDGKLYFKGTDGGTYELYVYDPVADITTAVTSANLNSSGSTNPEDMHALDGRLYFGAWDDGFSERELYVYDPDTGATTAVTSADLSGSGSTHPVYMHDLNGKLYFRGSDADGDKELYVHYPDDLTV